MSWFRQLKILYSLRVLIFTYIIWTIIINAMFGLLADYKLFFISLAAVMIMQVLKDRKKANRIDILVPLTAGGIALFLVNGENYINTILSLIYIGFVLYLLVKMDDEIISHELYVYRAKRAIYVLLAAGLITVFEKDISIKSSIGRLLIFYIITVVITLRESRQFQYKIRSKRSVMGNTAAVFIIILLSMDKVFCVVKFVILSCVKFLANAASYILLALIKVILFIIGKPLEKLVEIIKKWILLKYSTGNHQSQSQADTQMLFDYLPEKKFYMPAVVEYALGIIVLLVIIYFIFKFLKLEIYSKEVNNESEKIEREKIGKVKGKSKSTISDMLKKAFGRRDIKQEIFDIYRNFEKRMDTKGLFKSDMTASQLSNVASVHIKDRKPLDLMSDIYNETKFSEHSVENDRLHSMKDNYSKVKGEL